MPHNIFVSLFFLANVLFCVAYVARDMAKLRGITMVACVCTFPYFYFQPSPLWSAMFWQAAFFVINGVNLTILLLERRPVILTEEQQRLHLMTFHRMSPREMLKVLRIAQWHELESGEAMITEGDFINRLMLIYEGTARVTLEGRFKAHLGPGEFVGEMSYLTGKQTSADVIASEPLRFLSWERRDLDLLYLKEPALKDIMQSIIGVDLAEKLRKS